jgi:hypothetical protein
MVGVVVRVYIVMGMVMSLRVSGRMMRRCMGCIDLRRGVGLREGLR